MVARLIVLWLALAGVAAAQTPTQTELLGKTPSQVAAMGREAWFGFYTKSQGDSTMGMANAEHLFARSLGSLNDARIAKLPPARQTALRDLRKNLRDYAFACIDVGRAHSGGGTMWTPVEAGAGADVEVLLAALLGTKSPAAPRRRVSDVTRRLDRATGDPDKIAGHRRLPGVVRPLRSRRPQAPERGTAKLSANRGLCGGTAARRLRPTPRLLRQVGVNRPSGGVAPTPAESRHGSPRRPHRSCAPRSPRSSPRARPSTGCPRG